MSLHGQVAVVTGATRGLGYEMALAFAHAGASVAIVSRHEADCRDVAARLRSLTGQLAEGFACHVGHWQECDSLIHRIYERFERLDILVNNAGMSPLYPSLTGISEALFDKVMAVNLKGPFRLASLSGERMVAAGGGSIINISSIASLEPAPQELPYALAKSAINTMTVGLARTFAPKVRVNTIMPGPFRTAIAQEWSSELIADLVDTNVPLQRLGEPNEIVGAALLLAGEEGSFITGSTIKVDGGMAWAPA